MDLDALSLRVLEKVRPMLLKEGGLSVKQRSQVIAVCNWLGKYRAQAGVTKQAQVRGFLEAFYHCCEAEAVDVAQIILCVCVDEENETTFAEQLGKWGLYAEQVEVCRRLLALLDKENSSNEENSLYLGVLGRAYYTLGEYALARDCYERCLTLATAAKVRSGTREMVAVNGLALVAGALGDFEKGLLLHRRQLEIAEALGDEKAVGAALGDIGRVHQFRGEYERAIACFERYLKSCIAHGDTQGRAIALDNLGLACRALGQWERSLACHQESLAIAPTRYDEAGSWGNLGLVQLLREHFAEAIDCFERYQQISEEIGNRPGVVKALGNLGIAYYSLGRYEDAITALSRQRGLARTLGDRQGEGTALGNLGLVYGAQARWDEAILAHEAQLEQMTAIGYRRGMKDALGNLGNVFYQRGDLVQAAECHQRCLELSQALKDVVGVARCLGNLGNVLFSQGNCAAALACYRESLVGFRQVGDRAGEGRTLECMGRVLVRLGRGDEAVECLQQRALIGQASDDE